MPTNRFIYQDTTFEYMTIETYVDELIAMIRKQKLIKEQISKLKIRLCTKHSVKQIPTDIQVMIRAKKEDLPFLKALQTKPTRCLSGVSVVAVMTKPRPCPHGRCITCPGGVASAFGDVPQSYTGKEPATRRAMRNDYDPYVQVFNRLEQYLALGQIPQKVDLIIMGGTFPAAPKRYQDSFVTACFAAMNDFSRIFFRKGVLDIMVFREFFELPGQPDDPVRTKNVIAKIRRLKRSSDLESEHKRNETSDIRCVGLTIETRPDYATGKYADQMLRLGCTRVEIGAQSVYDTALAQMERGHTVADTIKAIQVLKDLCFKINIHYMLGLFVDEKEDLEGLRQLFESEDYRPDMLKLYPCMVLKGTKLYDLWKQNKYNPLTTEQAVSLIADFKPYVPEYCRIMRIQRDIPTYMTEAGVDRTNLRQYVADELNRRGTECRCIRCREVGRAKVRLGTPRFTFMHYAASKGSEFFIFAEDKGYLFGFCRLRFPHEFLRPEINHDSALIRELHVYGEAASLGKKGTVQHRGIGKRLMSIAEDIAHTYHRRNIVVISAVGTREYYRKMGYKKKGPYMVKKLIQA